MFVGWVKLHRETLEKAIWKCSTPEQKVLFITILMLANHKESQWIWKGKKYKCKPGQFITSLRSLSNYAMISEQSVRTALNKFEKLEFLTNESTKTGRLITICNWVTYQNIEIDTNKQPNKDLTKNQQRPNKGLTTNKNNKKEKNYNNDKKQYAEFVFLTEIEFNKLLSEYGNFWTKKIIDKLDNYKGSSGRKYKSDYRAILYWVIDDIKKSPDYNEYLRKKNRDTKNMNLGLEQKFPEISKIGKI